MNLFSHARKLSYSSLDQQMLGTLRVHSTKDESTWVSTAHVSALCAHTCASRVTGIVHLPRPTPCHVLPLCMASTVPCIVRHGCMHPEARSGTLLAATTWTVGSFWHSHYSPIHGVVNSAPHRADGAIARPSHGTIGEGASGNLVVHRCRLPS